MSQLMDQLRSAGVVTRDALESATRRQQIYGGSLDTVLLELDLLDAPTLAKQIALANGCENAPVPLLNAGPARPWDALPKSLLDTGWAMPLREHEGKIHVAIHPEIPASQREVVDAIEGVEVFSTCEAGLAKLAAERRGSVMPQRYAVLALRWVQALERPEPEVAASESQTREEAAPVAPWMTAPDTAPYAVPPPGPEPVRVPSRPKAPTSAPRSESGPESGPEPGPPGQPGEPRPVERASTYLYGLPVDDDDDDTPAQADDNAGLTVSDDDDEQLPPITDDEDELAPVTHDDAPPSAEPEALQPRPKVDRGASARPAASLSERLAGPRSALEEASERDQATEALVRAVMVISPRVALFGVKREGLRGLESPGEIPDVADQLVELNPKIEDAIEGRSALERATDLDLRIAVGQEMAVPCIFVPVRVQDRPVLMLYVDRNGETFTAEEHEAIRDLCEVAGHTLEGVLVRLREKKRESGPKPAASPVPKPGPPKSAPAASKLFAPPSFVPPNFASGEPAAPPTAEDKPAAPPAPEPPPAAPPAAQPPAPPAAQPPAPPAAQPPAPPVAQPPTPPAAQPPTPPAAQPVRFGRPPAVPPPSSPPSSPPAADKPPVRLKRAPAEDEPPLPDAPAPPSPSQETRPGLAPLSTPLGGGRETSGSSVRARIELDDEDKASSVPDAETREIDSAILAATRGGAAEIQKLRQLGEPALRRIAKQFPGELDVHRRDLDTLPPLPAHGPLIRVALEIGYELGPHLVEAIHHPNPTVRFYIAFVFMELRHERAVGALGELAFDPDADVRAISMRVLETYSEEAGFEETVAIIRRELDSPNRTRQLHSTRAVGTVRDIASVSKLIDLLASKERYIQEAALESLCSITGQQLGLKPHRWRSWYSDNAHHHRVEWIISSLAHKDLSVRRWAADELRRITGQRINFLAAGSKQEREIGIRKWVEWWTERGRAEFGA